MSEFWTVASRSGRVKAEKYSVVTKSSMGLSCKKTRGSITTMRLIHQESWWTLSKFIVLQNSYTTIKEVLKFWMREAEQGLTQKSQSPGKELEVAISRILSTCHSSFWLTKMVHWSQPKKLTRLCLKKVLTTIQGSLTAVAVESLPASLTSDLNSMERRRLRSTMAAGLNTGQSQNQTLINDYNLFTKI